MVRDALKTVKRRPRSPQFAQSPGATDAPIMRVRAGNKIEEETMNQHVTSQQLASTSAPISEYDRKWLEAYAVDVAKFAKMTLSQLTDIHDALEYARNALTGVYNRPRVSGEGLAGDYIDKMMEELDGRLTALSSHVKTRSIASDDDFQSYTELRANELHGGGGEFQALEEIFADVLSRRRQLPADAWNAGAFATLPELAKKDEEAAADTDRETSPKPTTTEEPEHGYTINDLESDLSHVHTLIDIGISLGVNNDDVDRHRADHLMWIARDLTETLIERASAMAVSRGTNTVTV